MSPAVLERARRALPAPLLAVVLVRALFLLTYPLNLMKTDGRDYLDMLVTGAPSLIHAPGYPFLIGLPFRNPFGRLLVELHPAVFHYLLCASQHAVAVVCLALAWRVAAEVFGRLPAALFVLAYGLSYQALDVTSASTPEWLQGSLVMLEVVLLYRAWQAEGRRKLLLWAVAGLVFGWLYLVKFNSVAMGWIPAAAAVAEVRRSRRAVVGVALAGLVAVATYGVFLAAVHRPATGSWAITLDKSWVLLDRLRFFAPDDTMSPATGEATARLLALNSVLPWPEDMRAWRHVDFVPPDVRAPYRARWGYLLTADRAEVGAVLAGVTVPRPYDFKRAFLPVATWIGLDESNDLGVAVFLEHVRAYPGRYLASVGQLTWRALTVPKEHWMYPLGLDRSDGRPLAAGFLRLPAGRRPGVEYRFLEPVVWLPGVRLFTLLYRLQRLPPPVLVSLLIAAGAAAVAVGCWRRRRLDRAGAWYLVGAAGVLAFVVFSNMVFHFRWKEVHPVLPVVCALLGASVGRLVAPGVTAWARWRERRPAAPSPARSPDAGAGGPG